MISKKYKEEYLACRDNVDNFIELVLKSNGLNLNTIVRRFYECRKIYGSKPIVPVKRTVLKNVEVVKSPVFDWFTYFDSMSFDSENGLVRKPGIDKLKLYVDMKRFKKDFDEEFLFKYGFTRDEIIWLRRAGEQIKRF